MVYYSKQALEDLNQLVIGLTTWRKHIISLEHAQKYYDDVRKVCDFIDCLPFHSSTTYTLHKSFGQKVFRYKRNSHTTWYIIYNIDENKDIFIEKILNNHLTNSGKI